MGDRDLDRLFLRYRDQGDVDALGALHDALSPELVRVAARLGPGAEAADDLVQATFLTAIRRAERYEAARPVTPWLVGLMANHAARMRRGESRRPDPARLDEERAVDPTEVVAARELRELVGRAVARLPERYRAVVEGAVLGGLTPTSVAAHLGREPGTVRVQLHRGLELLRRILPPSIATAVALRLAPAPQARALEQCVAREALLAQARAAALGAAHPATPLLGALIVNKALVALAAVALVVIAAWIGLGSGPGAEGAADDLLAQAPSESPTHGPTSPRPATPGTGAQADRLQVLAETSVPTPDRAPVPSAALADGSAWRLVGTVVGLDGSAAAGARVRVQGRSGDEPVGTPLELELAVDASGLPRFESPLEGLMGAEPRPQSLVVSLEHGLHRAEPVRIDLEGAPGTLLAQLDATALAAVDLRLVDELGDPLGQHFAALFDFPAGSDAPVGKAVVKVQSGDDGRLRLTVERAGRYALLSAAWKRRPATRIVELLPGAALELGDVALGRGESITGIARSGDEFQPQGTVVVGRLDGAKDNFQLSVGNQLLQLDWIDGAFEHIHCANAVVEDGRFELLGMAPRLYSITVYVSVGELQPEPLDVVASADEVQILDRAARVRLTVPAGFTAARALRVEVRPENGEPFLRDWDPFQRSALPIVVTPERPVELHVTSDAGHDFTFSLTAPAVGETLEYQLDLPGGPHGDLVLCAPEGLDLVGLEFIYHLDEAAGLRRSGKFVFPPGGEHRIEDLPARSWTLEFTPINAVQPTTLFRGAELTIVDGETTRLRLPTEAAGELPVTVRGSGGQPIEAKVVRVDGDRDAAVTVEAQFAGVRSIRYLNGNLPASLDRAVLLPPGRHQLRFDAEGHLSRTLDVEVRAGERGAPLEVTLDAVDSEAGG
ncbi:sigma-70 family RNA polymerase sigma factor [Engelhardtia mirabilis]|uniref:ECF RNA polymerase sigma factor SigW n=1 Tax=Engelhardtia mirabilis TaxID=2528011 RepID=A0A518BRB0_9BACT|nr:ECF RNA polymerase sigma factor SigW [Planctomycetes bacterium Pla133]QDV03827.1 ECF RNA polymerase sigma factor SigW [Planctomycetes bacterium Pla86]